MEKIEHTQNPFEAIKTVMKVARDRAAFHEDEIPIVNGLLFLVDILSDMYDKENLGIISNTETTNEIQLELPL